MCELLLRGSLKTVTMPHVLETFDEWIRALGVLGYLILALAALLEYVFPPFPGDTIALLGGAYVARGEKSMAIVLLVLTLGSLAGITATWFLGRVLAGRIDRFDSSKQFFGISVQQLHSAQVLMSRRGAWLLAINRFLPSFRSILFVAAGASGMPLSTTLILGGLSACLWNLMLVTVGSIVGNNASSIESFLTTYRNAALGFVVACVAGWALWSASRHLRRLIRRRM